MKLKYAILTVGLIWITGGSFGQQANVISITIRKRTPKA